MSLHEYINKINKMLEEAKEDTHETSRYLEDLEALFSIGKS